MKIKLLVCSILAICLAIATYGTVAYFSYEDNARTVITTSNVKIEVLGWSEQNEIAVTPGAELARALEIKNIGAQPAWVRVSVESVIELAENVQGEPDLSTITFDFDEQNWTLQEGYFYYVKKLESGETTEPLFRLVGFSKEMKNMYQKSKVVIHVKAEATQSANNGADVFEAAGWPN